MIELARERLADLGLLDRTAPPRINVVLSRGASVSAEIYLDRREFVYVKASELERLDDEYQSILRARELYGEFVPEPLAFVSRDGWDILMTRGLKTQALKLEHFKSQSVRDSLIVFFAQSARHVQPAGHTRAQLLGSLQGEAATSTWAGGVFERLGSEGLRAIETLPRIEQHGDFTCNNVGVTDTGIVVFDWEDFGAVSLPGLDLCALLISLAQCEPRRFRELTGASGSTRGPLGRFVDDACGALGIEPASFRRCLPLYVLVFLRLKVHYSANLRSALQHLMDSLVSVPARAA